jgi:hypothetical protein
MIAPCHQSIRRPERTAKTASLFAMVVRQTRDQNPSALKKGPDVTVKKGFDADDQRAKLKALFASSLALA